MLAAHCKSRLFVWFLSNGKFFKHSARHYGEYLAKISQKVISKRLTPHDFRHSLITEAVKAGVAPKDLMGITGHLYSASSYISTQDKVWQGMSLS